MPRPSKDSAREPLRGRSSQPKAQILPPPLVEASSTPEKLDHRVASRKSSKAGEIVLKDPFAQVSRVRQDQEPSLPNEQPTLKSRTLSGPKSIPREVPTEREESPLGTVYISHQPIPVVDNRPALLIGISGVSSSGKTGISHLLRLILPSSSPVFILHQDDFFIPKHLLVPSSTGELDADCRDAIDFAALIKMMEYAKFKGALPATFYTQQVHEKERALAISKVNPQVLEELKILVSRSGHFEFGRPVGIVDGFLLYQNPLIRQLLDIKILLRTSKEKSKLRRFTRPEYTGPDVGGSFFWRTPDYFDRVVWYNYSQEHRPLFENGDVEGKPLENVCNYLGISVQPELDQNLEDVLKWTVQSIFDSLESPKNLEIRNTETRTLSTRIYELCSCRDIKWLENFRQTLYDLL